MVQLERITRFLENLGFHIERANAWVTGGGFLRGIRVEGMTLYIDPSQMWSIGDILHDAGHVAIVPSLFRSQVSGDVERSLSPLSDAYFETHSIMLDDMGTEDMVCRALLQTGDGEAMAWSYAAAVAAEVPPQVVFHKHGYDGQGRRIMNMLEGGRHFGVHGLAAAKMTTLRTYPAMLRWLQV